MTKGEWNQALADLDAAARKMQDNPRAFSARGRCLNQLGRTSEAEADFRRSIELDPDNPEPLNALGRLLWLSGKKDEGALLFQKALERSKAVRTVKPGEIRFEGASPRKKESP